MRRDVQIQFVPIVSGTVFYRPKLYPYVNVETVSVRSLNFGAGSAYGEAIGKGGAASLRAGSRQNVSPHHRCEEKKS